jgi:hypothetical protein
MLNIACTQFQLICKFRTQLQMFTDRSGDVMVSTLTSSVVDRDIGFVYRRTDMVKPVYPPTTLLRGV